MIRTVSNDYIDSKSKYKHHVLGCCSKCRRIQVYKVTDAIIETSHWDSISECDACGGKCVVCLITKYQRPPGFARKCKSCDFRFACATTRMNEIPAALVGLSTIKYQGFQMCIKSGSGEECVGSTCPLYKKCMDV